MVSLNSRLAGGAAWRSTDSKSGSGVVDSSHIFSFPQFRRENESLQTSPAVVHITTVTEGESYRPQRKDTVKVCTYHGWHTFLLASIRTCADLPVEPGL